MDLPTELEIDSILFDLDGTKKSSMINTKRYNEPLPCLNDDQKLLDDLIAHIDDESFIPLKSYENMNGSINVNTLSKSKNNRLKKDRCANVYLGGSMDAKGIFIGGIPKSCDRLRCIGCDFKVLTFSKFKWSEDVDYLFFRNSMPEEIKLKTKLVSCKDSNAYCCQCQWTSTGKILLPSVLDCKSFTHHKWTCGGH